MSAYSYFIFSLEKEKNLFEEIKEAIKKKYIDNLEESIIVQTDLNHISISFSGYQFNFSLVQENWVVEESRDIAMTFGKNRKDNKELASCRERIEFYGDDDLNMDFFNESLSLLEMLSKEFNIVIFDYKNGKFFDEY
jgi:hypothetical protein